MKRKPYKKPTFDEFVKCLEKTGGNLTNTAMALGVNRKTIWEWCCEDEEFKTALQNARKKDFDQCYSTAKIVALGVPLLDENGKFVGWQVPPDSGMLKYFISHLGKDEGFDDSVSVTHTIDKGIDIHKWIERETSDE